MATPTASKALDRLRAAARRLKRDVVAVFFAGRDARMPWLARLVALAVASYALSPIDLIPDMIPVLGLLDDLVLVPLGIALALRLVPPAVMAEARLRAEALAARPTSRAAAVAIVVVWGLLAAASAVLLWPRLVG